MFKKPFLVFSSAAFVLASASAFAAREVHQFEVSVSVPSLGFYVIPADSGWIHQEQQLPWNLSASKLGSLRKYFDVKNEAGSINARLEGRPYLSNGTDAHDINLRVSFNGKLLSEQESSEVVSLTDAALGKRVLLEVVPMPPTDGVYKPGNYFGSVNMIFNAVLAGA
ncbi:MULTISPECIES: CS1 type fimbrial major subunit [unclassified Pseudomonas]|uniref:CS1 type fimbrial major subunit n=1 Tax=unclassified Pseudomonas TaxID=196821 RepID=UPI000CD02042|nr:MULTISPECIES: CS1 type fimbrial major subunit [unclassified Pseudomonas]POA26904.1 fimbrial assembly protein [Pseudomonas sp. GW456-R21]POA61811.1 fimbrial assembly protein [Pseudomonas sp. GW460-R15]